ncbi:MAG: hypothetical protein NT049_02165, partial [Planctomycetota bacterium]|nr:hypothetical protein [Planctomycetota bacterium]
MALPVVALGFMLMPQGLTDRVRVWASPLFSPLEDASSGWALDLRERLIHPDEASREAAGPTLPEQVDSLQNGMAQATALLNEYERRMQDLTRIREGLEGMPCRLVPARLVAPEALGGQASARLGNGADKGIRRSGAVISCRIDRGTRE